MPQGEDSKTIFSLCWTANCIVAPSIESQYALMSFNLRNNQKLAGESAQNERNVYQQNRTEEM